MSIQLSGRNAIITGASRGLGAELARAFWSAGANLFLVARSRSGLDRIIAGLPPSTTQMAHFFVADLADESAPGAIAEGARQVFKKLDILVNNAGIQGPIGPAWENNWHQWQAAIRVNLLAPVALCRACVPWMKEHRYGKIISLSGGGAGNPRPNFSAYAVAKAALVRFCETLAQEARELSIDVNCVAPGAMATDLIQEIVKTGPSKAGKADFEQAQKVVSTGGASLERAAALCVFLASAASDGISGKLISAVWDPWETLSERKAVLKDTDIYTLRRIAPRDRGEDWGSSKGGAKT